MAELRDQVSNEASSETSLLFTGEVAGFLELIEAGRKNIEE
jgi:hypothetical protein